ncbi:4580_t:CDS:2 [Racocetra persica]|uniref:4580_t:CDS:1 n=1 Tax=Racocetra persica TaxID=160502 RepID=A0ACA9N4H9_9GLOM|nr:4580_t:CDS:2 [Racocetra persica]
MKPIKDEKNNVENQVRMKRKNNMRNVDGYMNVMNEKEAKSESEGTYDPGGGYQDGIRIKMSVYEVFERDVKCDDDEDHRWKNENLPILRMRDKNAIDQGGGAYNHENCFSNGVGMGKDDIIENKALKYY